jgi:hypothetical protein
MIMAAQVVCFARRQRHGFTRHSSPAGSFMAVALLETLCRYCPKTAWTFLPDKHTIK